MQSPGQNSSISLLARLWQRLSHCGAYSPASCTETNAAGANPLRPIHRTRREMLCEHTRSLRLATDVDLNLIARTSHGLSHADLAWLCLLAAQNASSRQDELVRMADFSDALDRILMEKGKEKTVPTH